MLKSIWLWIKFAVALSAVRQAGLAAAGTREGKVSSHENWPKWADRANCGNSEESVGDHAEARAEAFSYSSRGTPRLERTRVFRSGPKTDRTQISMDAIGRLVENA
ncbi:MAG TPA: hypothetical protein DCP08_06570 [Chloroflexi bacterium]|nr:hypothetical protein [Chloroflexota bacterium]